MDINILGYDKNNELVMVAVHDESISKGNVVEVKGQLYDVVDEGTVMRTMDHQSKIIELKKYKNINRKVG